MALPRPSARVALDGRPLSLPEAAAASIEVALGIGAEHDRATLVLGPLSPWLDTAVGAVAEVELGTADDTTAVFTGTVEQVRHLPWGTVVDMLGPTAPLDQVTVGKAYTGQTVGDIARELINAGGATAGNIDAGPTLAIYYVDERRTCWRHLRALAAACSFELTADARGGVNVGPPRTGRADHTLRAGAELLSWTAGPRHGALAPADVGPFGAASEQGSEAWSLVHHEPGGSGHHRIVPAIRTREAASTVDQAASTAHRRRVAVGRALATGVAALRAGDLVDLDGVARAEATYRVRRARHRIDARGFLTAIDLEAS